MVLWLIHNKNAKTLECNNFISTEDHKTIGGVKSSYFNPKSCLILSLIKISVNHFSLKLYVVVFKKHKYYICMYKNKILTFSPICCVNENHQKVDKLLSLVTCIWFLTDENRVNIDWDSALVLGII